MSNAEQPFYRRPLWIVVAIFLAVALVGGGIAVVTGAFNGGDKNTAGPTPAPSSTGSAVPASAASVCGLKGYDEDERSDGRTDGNLEDHREHGSTAGPEGCRAG